VRQAILTAVIVTGTFGANAAAQTVSSPEGSNPLHPGILLGGDSRHPVHFTLDATATYGIGGFSALGAQLHFVAFTPVWSTNSATGSLDVGLVAGWQDEPQFLQYTSMPDEKNDAERLNTWVTVGHTIHFGAGRRVGIGVHLFAGWSHVWSSYSIDDPSQGLVGSLRDNYGSPNAGAMLKFDYRFSQWVGLSVQAVAPFEIGPTFITTIFHVGVGVCFYLG
jgi:hypothetical protein